MGRAGWEELECLSSSLQALPQGLPMRLWASPRPSLPRNPLSVFSLIDSQSYWCATRATTPKPSSYFRMF